ncbi:MAG: dicarboxylate/amino acid:cation symporter [Bacteroidales bacterium]|nr:dicarboxylate/amino acid:cation symporter [Bacteroidales bacterium]MBN2757467.1 dicarboxylate/amino acid:cation symporter [Bacteroidales bacterium]
MKIELHWQILIGLIFGIIFGIIFPTNFKLTNEAIARLEEKQIPSELIFQLKESEKNFVETETEFLKSIHQLIGEKEYAKYEKSILKESAYNPYLPYVSWMGDLFMRALKMIIVPLILTSIISGVANIGTADNLGRLGVKTMVYYMLTSTLAILIGLFFVNVLKPGVGVDIGLSNSVDSLDIVRLSFSDTLMNIVPTNIFKAFTEGNMLSIIFFSIFFGYFITRVSDKYRLFLTTFFNSAFEVMMKLTYFIILFTPIGILGIVASVVSEQAGDINKLYTLAASMGTYMFTVIISLFFHAVITLPLIMKYGFKANPWAHFKAMRSALLTAFSTSSSGATLSLTMSSVQENSGVSNKISSFTLPLGATINMDGTALYECIAAIFIAQAYGIELSILDQLIVVATALLASVGAAGIPMAGLVMITIILTAVGLPLEGVGLILAVDRILDMFRTSVNVWSDSCGAVIVAKSEGEVLNV